MVPLFCQGHRSGEAKYRSKVILPHHRPVCGFLVGVGGGSWVSCADGIRKAPSSALHGLPGVGAGGYDGEARRLALMPSWLFPAALTGGISLLTGALAVIWAEIKSSEARTAKQLDALRDDLKASEARQREEMREYMQASEARQQEALKAMEARQREEMREMREYTKALGEKVDRLVETMATVRTS